MEIESIRHKGLRRFFQTGNAKGLVGEVTRLRKMLAFVDAEELRGAVGAVKFWNARVVGRQEGTLVYDRDWKLADDFCR